MQVSFEGVAGSSGNHSHCPSVQCGPCILAKALGLQHVEVDQKSLLWCGPCGSVQAKSEFGSLIRTLTPGSQVRWHCVVPGSSGVPWSALCPLFLHCLLAIGWGPWLFPHITPRTCSESLAVCWGTTGSDTVDTGAGTGSKWMRLGEAR